MLHSGTDKLVSQENQDATNQSLLVNATDQIKNQ